MLRRFGLTIFLMGCVTETTTELNTCELDLTEPSEELLPGESLEISGGPFTAIFDSSIRFDQEDAKIEAIARTECSLCDSCREQAECSTCATCEVCETSCETCEETMTLIVPDLPSGPYNVVVRNSYGMSQSQQWFIVDGVEDGEEGGSD